MEVEKLKGVLTTNSDGFELFTHNHRTNLTYKLKLIWQEAIPVKIKIDDEYTTVFYGSGSEIYYDRGKNGEYQLHIGGRNLEAFLNSKIGHLLYITLDYRKDRGDNCEARQNKS